MALAQVIRFDERQQMGRPRRPAEKRTCVILQFPLAPSPASAGSSFLPDVDQCAGRGRDPG